MSLQPVQLIKHCQNRLSIYSIFLIELDVSRFSFKSYNYHTNSMSFTQMSLHDS